MVALLFTVVGAFTLAAQTLLLREYLVLHHGSELAIGFFFASWFAWIALASSLVWLRERRRAPARCDGAGVHRHLGRLVALYPVALGVQLLLVRSTRALAGLGPDESFGLADQALWTILTNAPVSIVTGLLFPAGCAAVRALAVERSDHRSARSRRHAGEPRSNDASGTDKAVARIYVAEALGSFVGGLVVTALLGTELPALGLGLGAAALLAALAAWYAWRRRFGVQVAVHGCIALVALGGLSPKVTTWLGEVGIRARLDELLPRAELLAVTDTPYEQAAVARLGSDLLLLANGKLVASLPNERAESARAALLATQPRSLDQVLVLGVGAEGLVRALLAFPIGALTYIEPDERAFRLAEPHLGAAERAALGDARVRVVFGDGRRLVDDLARQGQARFDLVVLSLRDPDTAAANRYFTLEFYQSVARLLGPGGVLATRTSAAANVLTLEQASFGASVDRTLGRAFANVLATGGEECWFFASNERDVVSVDATVLAERYGRLPVVPTLFPVEGYRVLLDRDRTASFRQQLDRQARDQGDALLNRDTHPVSYLLGLLVLGRQLGLPLGGVLRALREVGPWLVWIPLLLGVLGRLHHAALAGPRPERRPSLAALVLFAVGLASIAIELVLTLAFQSRFGLLYQQVGLVSALFMGGLALGAALGVRLTTNRSAPASTVVTLCLMALWALAVPLLAGATNGLGSAVAHALFYLAFVVTGAIAGAALPLAGRLAQPTGRLADRDARSRASRAQGAARIGALVGSADHWGAALGAVAAGTLLVPLLGQRVSCQLFASVLVGAAALVVGELEPARTRAERLLRRFGLLRAPADERARRRVLSFPWTRLSYGLVVTTAAAVLVGAAVRSELVRPGIRLDVRRIGTFVAAARFEERSEPFVHVAALGAQAEQPHNVSFASEAVVHDVAGFGGPLNLLVSMDADGTIRRVELLDSQETPAYIRELGAFLHRFEGKKGTARFRFAEPGRPSGDYELDGIAGATVSSRAALETINQATKAASQDLLGLAQEVEPHAAAAAPSPWSREILYLLATLALGVAVLLRGPAWLRVALLGANLVVGGLWLNVQLSLAQLGELAALELPPVTQLGRRVLLAGVVLLGLGFGPAYCALLCPFGAAQELAHRAAARRVTPWLVAAGLGLLLADTAGPVVLPNVAGRAARTGLLFGAIALATLAWRRAVIGPRGPLPARATAPAPTSWWSARARYLKYLLAAAALVTMALGAWPSVAELDPLATAFSRRYGLWSFVLLAAILVVATTHFRPFCRHLCPVGALLHLTNKLALLGRWLPTRRFASCELDVRSRFDVDCIQCSRCVATHGGRALPVRAPADASPQASAGALLRHPGDRALLAALVLLVGLLVARGVAGEGATIATPGTPTDPPAGAELRESVDSRRIRRLIGEGKLSDHEASHYRPEGQAPSRPRDSARGRDR